MDPREFQRQVQVQLQLQLQHQLQHQLQQQQQPPQGMVMNHNNPLLQNPNAAALMDPREIQHQLQWQQQQQLLQGMVMNHNNPSIQNPKAVALMDPREIQHQLQQQPLQGMVMNHNNPLIQNPNAAALIDPASIQNPNSIDSNSLHQQEQPKKKRGRPRKYVHGSNISNGLALTLPLSSASNPHGNISNGLAPTLPLSHGNGGGGGGDSGRGNPNSSQQQQEQQQQPKRKRGRPLGSTNRDVSPPIAAETYAGGWLFHILHINSGEDIADTIMRFTQQGRHYHSSHTIISASGSVSSVLLQEDTSPTGVVMYEGQFEIFSLGGFFLNSEKNGIVTKTGELIVTLFGGSGGDVAGTVAGKLIARSQVQVNVVSIGHRKKQRTLPAISAPGRMVTVGGGSVSSQFQGLEHSSEAPRPDPK